MGKTQKPPQPQPKKQRPRKGRVLHAQSAFRTYICSNLNLCTLPMSLSHKKKNYILQQYFQCVIERNEKTRQNEKKEAAAANTKRKKKQRLRGIIKFQYYLHQRIS